MNRIYENADSVTVWLGTHYEDSHAAFQCMSDILCYWEHEHPVWAVCTYLEDKGPADKPGEVLSKRGLVALHHLLTRGYWNRMWIVQELTVARNIIFRAPGRAVSLPAMLKVQSILQDAQEGNNGFPPDKVAQCLEYDPFPLIALLRQGMVPVMEWKSALASGKLTFHDCLLFHNLREASDPRDKLFALASLATGRSQLLINVDYGSNVTKVYSDFATAEIETYKKLDVLTSVHMGELSNPEGLPSWAPCWATPNSRGHLTIRQPRSEDYNFGASKERYADFKFLAGGHVLRVKGISVGEIKHLGQQTLMRDHEEHDKGTLAIYEWWKMYRDLCSPHDTPSTEKFIQTINCAGERENERSLTWMLEGVFKALMDLYKIHVKLSSNLLPLDEETENECVVIVEKIKREVEEAGKVYEADETVGSHELHRKLYTHFIYLWDRRFFLLDEGIVGMAPKMAIEGDVVCVLFGCPHPMVLRSVEDHYIIIGEAYVHGYMYGQAIDRFERGELDARYFELH
jgi:hypothetical protein